MNQQLFANVPKGAPQQLFWGIFLRVCFRPYIPISTPVCEAGFSTPVHITVKQMSKNRLDVENDMTLVLTNALLRISRLVAQLQAQCYYSLAWMLFVTHMNVNTLDVTSKM